MSTKACCSLFSLPYEAALPASCDAFSALLVFCVLRALSIGKQIGGTPTSVIQQFNGPAFLGIWFI